MRIWIDLANSPHVLFFAPVVKELARRGIDVFLTARDFAQTVALAKDHGLGCVVIGRHGGKGLWGKGREILDRARRLRHAGHTAGATVAVSHNSYAHALAARSLGLPCLTIMDYEHTPANHVAFRAASRVLLPRAIPDSAVAKYGACTRKIWRYDGFKEQIYLDEFVPDRTKLDGILPSETWNGPVVAVARPPADFAVYHRFENPLFEVWLRRAAARGDVRVIVLPRTAEQATRIAELALGNVIVPARAVDGANLVYHADLVVSAGGTMNREAAVVGTPAYSIFAGRTAAVDVELERLGRLAFVRTESDLDRIRLEPKKAGQRLAPSGLRDLVIDRILELGGR